MKLKPAILFLIPVTACALLCAALSAKPRERILVLGFESSQLNDIQDRLLREAIMRRLQTDGFAIVPVMEIESVFTEERKGKIRKTARRDMREVCRELDAGYALFGSIAPGDGKRDEGIIEGRDYVCRLVLYGSGTGAFTDIRVSARGGKTLYEFYDLLSGLIAAEIGKLF